jgi:cyclopropane fatty-acyl-phospholipid synthase-like methyltransferase
MDDMKYFYELFSMLPRQGPGDNRSTQKAFSLLRGIPSHPYILDIGCGRGMQTIELARISQGTVIALDNYQPFLDALMVQAQQARVAENIIPRCQSMLEMDFGENTFDIIWSEGALYFMGFANGLRKCRQLLKEQGYLAVTEIVYLSPDPPVALQKFFQYEYPDIGIVNNKIELIMSADLNLLSHFTLPKSSWMENFYAPMEKAISMLKEKYHNNEVALKVFENSQQEINLYREYSDYFGYEFFVMQKRSEKSRAPL